MTLLAVRDLSRRPLLEGCSFDLEPGEVLRVTGPSGSGKTLLLRALADLDPIDGGRVELRGRDRAAFSPAEWRARVLFLHQVPVRLPGSPIDNLEQVRSLACRSGQAPFEVDDVLARIPLERAAANAPMAQLSGGEAQRLALYRALALGPDVLLLDEPTSALDPAAARAAEAAVLDWTRAGGAALWVTHDPHLAARVPSRELRLP